MAPSEFILFPVGARERERESRKESNGKTTESTFTTFLRNIPVEELYGAFQADTFPQMYLCPGKGEEQESILKNFKRTYGK